MKSFDLEIGVPTRVRGVYVAHWELGHLKLRVRGRLSPVWCSLEAAPGIAQSVFEAAKVPAPENPRLRRGVRFDVEADVTPLEHGRFGHMGTQRWRLRVDNWAAVSLRGETPSSIQFARRAAMSVVPLAAIALAVAMAVLALLSLPNSSPPSESSAQVSAVVFWAAATAMLAGCAWWGTSVGSASGRRGIALAGALLLAGVGLWVAGRFDVAWVDACQFGTGAGNRCLTGDGSAPMFVAISWPLLGLLVGAMCNGIAAVARLDHTSDIGRAHVLTASCEEQ